MTRAEYNKKIQAMQEIWPESSTRIVEQHGRAIFQVYLDRWRTLGIQRHPFQDDAEYEWDKAEEARVMYHFAGAVTSDRLPPRT